MLVVCLITAFGLGRWSAPTYRDAWPPTAHAQNSTTLPERVRGLTQRELEESLEEFTQVIVPGVALPAGHSAVVPDPKGRHAQFLNAEKQFEELEFRLSRRSPTVVIPPEGGVLVRDIRDQLWYVAFDGRATEVLDDDNDNRGNRGRYRK